MVFRCIQKCHLAIETKWKEFVQGLNKKKTWLKREGNEEDFDYLFEDQRLKINKLRVQKLIEQIW